MFFKKLVVSYSQHKLLCHKTLLFLFLSYVFVPGIIYVGVKDLTVSFSSHFFSLPAFTLILVIFFIIYNRDVLSLSYTKTQLWLRVLFSLFSLSFFLFYYLIRYEKLILFSNIGAVLLVSWILYLLAMVVLALAIYSPSFFQKTYFSMFVFSIVASFFYILTTILWQAWYYLSLGVARAVVFLFSLFTTQTSLQVTQLDPIVTLKTFTVIIGPPCSGIESLSMFFGLWLLLFVYEQDKLNLFRSVVVLFIGLIGAYVLNIFRVALILLIGTRNPELAVGMFHSQAGWVLFSVFILVLLYFLYPWMRIAAKKNK